VAARPPFTLPDLPIVAILDELRHTLARDRRAIVVAPPGSGKTTVVPLALLDEPWLAGRRIVMLEPRRLATRAAAQRMAATTGTAVGDLVGYQTRDERHIGERTRIEVVTEGVLTRRMQRDPELAGTALVIFDEVHERNLTTDLGLAMAIDVASTIRPDLAILAMSATPDTDGLRRVLDAPVISSDGRLFDIDIRWAPRSPQHNTPAGRNRRPRQAPNKPGASGEPIEPAVVAAVRKVLADDDGDVLVFLPGIGEIRRVEQQLAGALPTDVDVYALAGALTLAEQDMALAPSPPGRRRVVLSTDIAETSLTVDGVRIVIDSGLAREPRFDSRTGLSRLTTVTTSRASADQRAGRAGRTEPGVAVRLWSKIEHGTRAKHRSPEILQADLAGFALELAAWGTTTGDLAFIDQPPPRTLDQARELLRSLHALEPDGTITHDTITPLGRSMLSLPVHPRLARMVAVDRSALACLLAALVDERDVFRGRPDDLPADLALRVAVITGAARHDAADRGAVHRLRDRAADVARRAGIPFDLDSVNADRTGAVLLLAYPDRVAGRRRHGQFQLRSGTAAWVPEDDTLAAESFIVAADLDGRGERSRVRLAAAVDPADVIALFAPDIIEQRTLRWDDDRNDLVETVERRLGAIQLGQSTTPPEPGPEVTEALVDRVRRTGLDLLPWSAGARSLCARVTFLHRTIGDPWPDWSTEGLSRTLDHWLAPFVVGAVSRRALDRLDLVTVLRSQLPWPTGGDLDRLAPPSLELPTGRSVPIDYGGERPTAAVRVQDLFGVNQHPVAAATPIVLELLSPADRPIQITADLPGFWAGSWAEVRKDMAGRYPKHQWPADPATAAPKRLKGN
jgi:ATP-dependent helicase HrpB